MQEQYCNGSWLSSFANANGMNDSTDKTLIEALAEYTGLSPSKVATGAGLAVSTLTRPANSQVNHQLSRTTLDKLRAKYPDFPGFAKPKEGDRPAQDPDQPLTKAGNEGTIALRQVDIRYSMGPGSSIEDYPDEGSLEFDANLLRIITNSPPERLFVAKGDGDSMFPTLINDDMIIIDTLQTRLNLIDKIWAISLYGGGGIKRLRAIAKDKVEVISDNPAHENQIVNIEDLHIVGRVVWVGRRI